MTAWDGYEVSRSQLAAWTAGLTMHVYACRLLYVLAFMQFTMSAFYEPAKRALTPLLVAPEDLHLATTLDSFAWSLMGAVGASLGGWFASRFGTAACFGLDACSYLVAALCAVQLKVGRTMKFCSTSTCALLVRWLCIVQLWVSSTMRLCSTLTRGLPELLVVFAQPKVGSGSWTSLLLVPMCRYAAGSAGLHFLSSPWTAGTT